MALLFTATIVFREFRFTFTKRNCFTKGPFGFYAGPNPQCNLSPYPVDEANTLYADGDGIDAIRVATGFSYPLYVGAPPGDTGWLFVAEQHGLIKIINLPSRTVNAIPFLDIPSNSDKAKAAEFSG